MDTTIKGFIKDWSGKRLLPITRGELVLDEHGNPALTSAEFEAGKKGSYGLISAADLALLKGGEGGQGITDIYAKLKAINEGIKVGETSISFYNTSGVATPIKFNAVAGLVVGVANNVITFGLTSIHTNEIKETKILKSISVDTYGRVTSVSSGDLTTDEIPHKLVGKELSGCTTDVEDIADNKKAIVNKAYVDKKFTDVAGMATGALKFGGAIPDSTVALNFLNSNTPSYLDYYFKVTKEFDLNKGYFYDPSASIKEDVVETKPGDTLIITNLAGTHQYVHVPSGDDITKVTVTKDGEGNNPTFPGRLGHMTLQFSEIFNLTNPSNGNTAYISFPEASATKSGYLKKEDYVEFKSYKDTLAVSYTPVLTSGDYQIGTLTIGSNSYDLYGKNNVSSLTLTNGASNEYNPILKFTEAGVDTNITLKGLNGVTVKRDGTSVTFTADIKVHEDYSDYLAVTEGHKIGVKLGSFKDGGYNEGLVDFGTLNQIKSLLSVTTTFEEISYSLSGDASKEFQYGNENLKKAVAVTI